jgi:hypothetical protein
MNSAFPVANTNKLQIPCCKRPLSTRSVSSFRVRFNSLTLLQSPFCFPPLVLACFVANSINAHCLLTTQNTLQKVLPGGTHCRWSTLTLHSSPCGRPPEEQCWESSSSTAEVGPLPPPNTKWPDSKEEQRQQRGHQNSWGSSGDEAGRLGITQQQEASTR